MTGRVCKALAGLVVLLATTAPCSAMPAGTPEARPAAQARVESLVMAIVAKNRGEPAADLPAMAEQLQRSMDDDREALLLQLVLYVSAKSGNERMMGAALLIDSYSFTNEERIAALVPHLETDDPRLRDVMWDVLSTVDRPQGGRPDFGPYETVLRASDPAPAGLTRYLYEVSPIDALDVMARTHAADEASVTAVRRARGLEELRARQEPGAGLGSERARGEIDALSRDAAWWVRLYVAYFLRARPDLGSPVIVERLRSDEHELVREQGP
jgi:hypothetical protein